jgi:hypothetical protein
MDDACYHPKAFSINPTGELMRLLSRLNTGMGWKFFLGGLDILSEPEDQGANDTADTVVIGVDDLEKEYEEKRKKVIDKFNRSNVLTNVSDLFATPPEWVLFNPIVADIHVPISLQDERHRGRDSLEDLPQDFKILYDGQVLVVAALCSLERTPWGVYDVRDRFKDVLSTICKFEEVPPCLTHQCITLFDKKEQVSADKNDLYIGVDLSSDFMTLARWLCLALIQDMRVYYYCCQKSKRVDESVSTIHETESCLLDDLKEFLKVDWWKVLAKRRLTAQSKQRMIEILGRLSKHSQDLQGLQEVQRNLDDRMKHKPLLNEFVKKIRALEEYDKPREGSDIDSSMRIVEHARTELETYSISSATMLSALIGAIIGSILTLLVTYLLGNLSHIPNLDGNSTRTSFIDALFAFLLHLW